MMVAAVVVMAMAIRLAMAVVEVTLIGAWMAIAMTIVMEMRNMPITRGMVTRLKPCRS